MHPLNKAKRKKTFTNFLLLFILSIAIITTTIFFSIQVPLKQNDQLLREMRSGARDREFLAAFTTDLSGIAGMLDTINTKAQKPDLLDGSITESIKRLNTKVEADSSADKSMYRSVVFILSDLQAAKKQLRDKTGNAANADDLRKQLDAANAGLDAAKLENLNLKQQIFMLQQRH